MKNLIFSYGWLHWNILKNHWIDSLNWFIKINCSKESIHWNELNVPSLQCRRGEVMAFLQISLLHPLSALFSWLFGQGGRGASLTSSAPALQPQRAFCDGSPRLSLAFDPPGHTAVAAYQGCPQGADQVTFPPRSQLLQQQEQQHVSRDWHTRI